MDQNPYKPGQAASTGPRTPASRWLIGSGITSLIMAVACIVITVVRMILSFNTIAGSGTQPAPSDLAQGIRVASLPAIAAFPLGLLGMVLLIAGLVIRRPVD